MLELRVKILDRESKKKKKVIQLMRFLLKISLTLKRLIFNSYARKA